MSVEKKFDLKALASMDVKDLFKKRNVSGEDREKTSKAMMKPVVSFDFGSSFIKIVEGRYVRGQLKVSKWFKVETPVGAIVDGKIMDKISLVNALEQGLKLYKLKATDAICVINSTQIINRELLIPVVADDEVETVVRYEIQKFLPINLDDYLVQYVKLGEVEVNGAMKYRLNIITFPQKMGYAYYELMKELDLKPYVLDVSYNAIGKLCNYTKMLNTVTDAEGTVAFVDMGAQSIDLNIFNRGNVQFTRIVKTGGSMIDARLSDSSNISIKSAVSLKESIADLCKRDDLSDEQQVVQRCVDDMISDLERVLQFYRNKEVGNKVDHIFVIGGSAKMRGLVEYMEQKLGVATSYIEQLENVELSSDCKVLGMPEYFNAIGAMIRL